MSAAQTAAAEIASLIRARNPLLLLVTREEERAAQIVTAGAASAGYPVAAWDCAAGITDQAYGNDRAATDITQALAAIRDRTDRKVWILNDASAWLADPNVCRMLRNLCQTLPYADVNIARTIVITSPKPDLPPELQGCAITIDVPLPDRAEMAQLLDNAINGLRAELRDSAAPNGTRDAAIDAALGLSESEASRTFARSIVLHRRIDPGTVVAEKQRVIARDKLLECVPPLKGGLDSIGGLDGLKTWLRQRTAAFTPAARAYGLPAPRGALLVGVSGCGKTLTAKAIAAHWNMPLLKLDANGLKSKFVGESEGNLRKALKTADAMAPCVLWIDEIEKAMAGATQGAADGGVSADILGTLLTFMQERTGSVFVIATANDVSKLPPELLRKGRFDELFFVDLPNATERRAIVAAAMREHSRSETVDLDAVADQTRDFAGAEIAALVPAAMFAAFADGARPLTTADLIAAARQTVPLSKTAADKIAALREWAKGRARPASTPETETRNATPAFDL